MSPILTHLRMREPKSAAAAVLIAVALQACGGGGSTAPPAPMPSVTLSVSPTSITAGQSATLMWSSTQAASCTASGAWSGSQAATGSQAVTPTTSGSVTYTLTCAGASGGAYGGGGGLTGSQTTTLTVNPATAFAVKPLVADGAGVAATQDANLVNPWGLVFAANAPVWISNNGTNTSSLYDGNGTNENLLVVLPSNTDSTPFQPTGIVSFDPTNFPDDFVVTAAGKSGPSSFIYAGLNGQIAGWNAAVDLTHAVTAYSANDKACYRALAIANNGSANFLYANDFVGGKIDVFDAKFTKQSSTAFPFTDAKLPPNYAPFGIQAIANGPNGTTQIYVSYAMSGTGANQGSCEDTRGNGAGAEGLRHAEQRAARQQSRRWHDQRLRSGQRNLHRHAADSHRPIRARRPLGHRFRERWHGGSPGWAADSGSAPAAQHAVLHGGSEQSGQRALRAYRSARDVDVVVNADRNAIHRSRQSACANGCGRAELALRSFFSSGIFVVRTATEHLAHGCSGASANAICQDKPQSLSTSGPRTTTALRPQIEWLNEGNQSDPVR
jgi:hypothetical protein